MNPARATGPDAGDFGPSECGNDELEWGKRHIPEEPHVFFADRVTALHDIPLAPGLEKFRKRTHRRKAGRLHHKESGGKGT